MKYQVERRLFALEDAAAYLGVSRGTMRRFVESGELKTFRLPSTDGSGHLDRILIKREELEKLVERGIDV